MKSQINIHGRNGVDIITVVDNLQIQHTVALYLIKQYLQPNGYIFKIDDKEIVVTSLTSSILPKGLTGCAPIHLLSTFYGAEGHDVVNHVEKEDFTLLEAVAHHQTQGLTATEIVQVLGKPALQNADRLTYHGVLVKRLVIPLNATTNNNNSTSGKRKGSSGPSPRCQGSVTIYHVKRFARLYQPELDQVQLHPGDDVRDLVLKYLRDILDRNQLDLLAVVDLALHYIDAYDGIGTTEIRKFTSVGRKRAGKIVVELGGSRFGYPSLKVQEGKQIVYKIFSKAQPDNPDGKTLSNLITFMHGHKLDASMTSPGAGGGSGQQLQKTPVISIGHEEKNLIVLDYIQNQPSRVGSVLEVTQLIRKNSKEQGISYMVDRKTVARCIERLVQSNQVEVKKVSVPHGEEDRFNRLKEMEIIYFPSDKEDLDERIEDYMDSYCYVRITKYSTSMNENMTTPAKEDDVIAPLIDSSGAVVMDVGEGEEVKREDNIEINGDVAASVIHLDPLLDVETEPAPAKGKRKRSRKPAATATPTPTPTIAESIMALGEEDIQEKQLQVTPKRRRKGNSKKSATLPDESDLNKTPTTIDQHYLTNENGEMDVVREEEANENINTVEEEDPEELEEDNILWVSQSDTVIATTSSQTHSSSTGALISLDNDWSQEEDMLLLELFMQHLIIRRAKLGLPGVLKPLVKIKKRIRGSKSYFVVYPRNSSLDLSWPDFEISTMRPFYFRNCCVAIGKHTLSSSRRRLTVLLRSVLSLNELATTVFFHRHQAISSLSRLAINHVLASSLTLRNDMCRSLQSHLPMLAILKRFNTEEVPFMLHDILPHDSDKLTVRQYVQVLRELYMHGIIRRLGSDAELDNLLETPFMFSRHYMNNVFDQPFGGLFGELVACCLEHHSLDVTSSNGHGQTNLPGLVSTKRLITNSGLDSEAEISRSLLLISHQVGYSFRNLAGCSSPQAALDTLESTATVSFRLKAREYRNKKGIQPLFDTGLDDEEEHEEDHSNAHDERGGHPSSSLLNNEMFLGDDLKCREVGGTSTQPVDNHFSCEISSDTDFGPVDRFMNRLQLRMTLPCTLPELYALPNLSYVHECYWEQPELCLPWLDYVNHSVKYDVFGHFATEALTFLSQHPAASVASIHCAMMILPLHIVEILLKIMESLKLIRAHVVHRNAMVMQSPFDSVGLWKPRVQQSGSSQDQIAYYEIVMGDI
eukprot:scaffold2028_cov181-Ochromonas_danica.AAC.6